MPAPIRFEQDPDSPPGTGSFTFSDGRSIFAHEPELASKLGPDMRTAMGPVSDPEGMQMARDFVGQTPGMPAPAPPAAEPGGPLPERFQTTPREQQAAAPPQAAPKSDGMQSFALPERGGAPAQEAPPPLLVRQSARAGGMAPVGSTITTEAGPAYSMEDAADRATANRDVVKATMAQHEAAAQAAENEARALRIQGEDLRLQEADQQRELRDKDDRYKAERARAEVYVKAAEERKLDPKKLYKDAGIGGSIALIIGQALGAFGASLAGGENWAGKMVGDAMDRDMAAQEDEIKSGRASANNALARLSEEMGGDVEQAKSALKMTRLAALDAQIKEHAAWAKVPQAQQAADLWLAQNQQARLAEEQKFQQASMGKTTTTASLKYQAPQAGGARPMSAEEEAKYWKAKAEGKKNRELYEGNALDEADAKAVERYGKLRTGPENLIGQVSDVASLAGGGIKNGKVQLGSDVPGVGPIASRLHPLLRSEEGNRIQQTIGNLAADVVKDKSGAAVTDSERALLMRILEGGVKTETELQSGLQIIHNYADRKRRNVEASFPAPVRQTYKRQGADSVRDDLDDDESDVEKY